MNIYSLKCPNCNADLEIEDGLDTFFCKYCGSKIVLEGQSGDAYRARTRVKEMEHDERMAEKKYEHEKYKIKEKNMHKLSKAKIEIITAVSIVTVLIVFLVVSFSSVKKKSIKQEQELQQLVDEIMIDIENQEFDTAYIKAQSIDYTEDWSSDIDEKWDKIRKEVINQIIEEEKNVTGSSNHKPEKDGFFDG
ncbi:MAG: hypothetical protein ACI4Q5_08235, partial [Porcipelethomonas sp.]